MRAFEGPPLGPGLVAADYGSVLAALERFDPAMDWDEARGRVLPMLPRARPMPGPSLDLVRTVVPPGILVGFGIDLGPAVTFVSTQLLERWGVDAAALAGAALANLDREAARCDGRVVVQDRFAGEPIAVAQTRRGFAASLILVPDHLPRLFGPGPHVLLAPMRDILICLPGEVDAELAAFLSAEWEALDPNHLHLGAFRHEAGRITALPLGEVVGRA